ncbi:ABC1 family-domain-containing protein [Xylaria bambusicola]|uniref:ABC1 family-domain-containing protein n=1 Tax=Xylaria bambusicola TaxID=326684 RepID=UPI002007797A|nr:ABC1 family-domain-containing protein [Xylaria bambusicola]KAI0521117.1 ABC1 family-domain-containing protein [Xylaria bambusicola]
MLRAPVAARHCARHEPSRFLHAGHFGASIPRSRVSHARAPIQLRQQRSVQTNGAPFEPLRPPSPSSLGQPQAARQFKRGRKWGRRLLIFSAVTGSLYLVDRTLFASGVSRSLFTFGTGLFVALDYKLNFRPEPLTGGTIEDLHRRSAERLFELLRANGGLYLKIGQAIAMQSAVLPPEFQRMFARMFDDAPQVSWKNVDKVIRQDFGGKSAEEVFGVSFTGEEGKGLMERRARASASVAQVHWARLPDGREVAVKIQKPEIAKQVGWDLWAFKVVMRVYTWWFDLPLYSIVPFITERLMLETDFKSEAENSEVMRKLVNSEPSLKDRVYIPQVYPEFTTKRVLVTEWIEGVRLWDKAATTGRWLGGYGNPSAGVHGEKLKFTPADTEAARKQLRYNPLNEKLKPEREQWKGRNGKGGLGLSSKDVMSTMVDLFSAQIFKWGVVHCDPHPGNIFIRRLPSGKPELVLIDHGLYVYMEPKFRQQYALFWKSLMTFDNKTIADITEQWGIKAPDIFASATLMRPYEGGDGSAKDALTRELSGKTKAERHYEMQQRMKQGIRDVLADEDKWPKELVFIGRNMRIVQGNNQFMGSPVNRVKMMGNWASASLFQDRNLPLGERLLNAWRHLLFKTVLFATDVAFYTFKVRQWLGLGGGMEDEVEKRMAVMAKDFGVELQHEVFEG